MASIRRSDPAGSRKRIRMAETRTATQRQLPDFLQSKNSMDKNNPNAGMPAKLKHAPAFFETHTGFSVTNFAQGSLHELSSIDTILLGYLELTKRELHLHSPVQNHLSEIENGCNRLKHFCDLLRDFCGMDQNRKETINLNALLEEVAEDLPVAGIDLTLQCEAPLPFLAGNPLKLQQVVRAIFNNSIEAKADRIFIETGVRSITDEPALANMHKDTKNSSYVFLEITDSGTGIAMAVLPLIFDPFFTTKFVGQGMGLAAAWGIMKNHFGEILVKSEPGLGTIFTLCFPKISEENQS